MRINQFIARAGVASRRKADVLIEEGRIKINSSIAKLGDVVADEDVVYYDDNIIKIVDTYSYYMMNKPVGIECTTNLNIKNNIIAFSGLDKRIFPVGRLDKNSSGLIILTDDGDFSNLLMSASKKHEKEYVVKVDRKIDENFIKNMRAGVPILDRITRECEVFKISENEFKIILTQGWNRQIRRMCEYFDYKVLELKRIRILNLEIGNLKLGKVKKIPLNILEDMKKKLADNFE